MMIPEYHSSACINPQNSNPQAVPKTGKNAQNRFHGLSAWNDWVVSAPSDKSLFICHLDTRFKKLSSAKIQIPFEVMKILDFIVYTQDTTIQLFVCSSNLISNTDKQSVTVHEYKYTNVTGIDDITEENLKKTKLFEHERNEGHHTGENNRKVKLSLAFDKNPYEFKDAKVSRIYSSSRKEIFHYDVDKQGRTEKPPKFKSFRHSDVSVVSLAVSPHDMKRVAIACEAHKSKYEIIHHVSQEQNSRSFEWSLPGLHKCEETLAWHPTQQDWFCTVKIKPYGSMEFTVCIMDFSRLQKRLESKSSKHNENQKTNESSLLWNETGTWITLPHCKQFVWRPGSSNRYQMLSIHQGFNQNFGSIYMWDIRRPHIAIAVFKLQEQVTSPKIKTDDGDVDQFDDNMNTDWIASFSVTNDGTSMFVMTSHGNVHYFDLTVVNGDIYSKLDMPLQAIAISPFGDLINSTSRRNQDPISEPVVAPRERSISAGTDGSNRMSHFNPEQSSRFRNTHGWTSESGADLRDEQFSLSQDDLSPTTDAAENFVASRKFQLFQTRVDEPAELKLAKRIFSDKIYSRCMLEEAKYVADQAAELEIVDWDFYQDIVRFLELDSNHSRRIGSSKIPESSKIQNSDSIDDTDSEMEENISPMIDNEDDPEVIQDFGGDSQSAWPNEDSKESHQGQSRWINRKLLRESPIERRLISSHFSDTDSDTDDPACDLTHRTRNLDSSRPGLGNDELLVNYPNHKLQSELARYLDQFKLEQLAKDILYFGMDGSLQGAVIGMCLLKDYPIVEEIKKIAGNVDVDSQLQSWFFDYIDISTRSGLFTHRAQIIRLSPIEKIRKLWFKGPNESSSKSVTYDIACGECHKHFKPPFCDKPTCRNVMTCTICNLPLKKLLQYCRFCGHAAHIDHFKEWFATEKECPKPDCDCPCIAYF